jgi:uncharacterized membrane protein YkoI
MTRLRPFALLLLIAAMVTFSAPVHADDDAGKGAAGAQPVSAVLNRFHSEFRSADVLEVELETEQIGSKQVAVYEIKAFTRRGAVLKVYYDARTLKRLSVKGRRDRDDD